MYIIIEILLYVTVLAHGSKNLTKAIFNQFNFVTDRTSSLLCIIYP